MLDVDAWSITAGDLASKFPNNRRVLADRVFEKVHWFYHGTGTERSAAGALRPGGRGAHQIL